VCVSVSYGVSVFLFAQIRGGVLMCVSFDVSLTAVCMMYVYTLLMQSEECDTQMIHTPTYVEKYDEK
jgi:hypothetical protein